MPARHISRSIVAITNALKVIRHTVAEQTKLNTSEFELLQHIYYATEPQSVKALSNKMLLCSQAITKIARTLDTEGCLVHKKSTGDRRVTFLYLTDRGKALVEQEERLRDFVIQACTQQLQPDQLQAAAEVLQLVEQNARVCLPELIQPGK